MHVYKNNLNFSVTPYHGNMHYVYTMCQSFICCVSLTLRFFSLKSPKIYVIFSVDKEERNET